MHVHIWNMGERYEGGHTVACFLDERIAIRSIEEYIEENRDLEKESGYDPGDWTSVKNHDGMTWTRGVDWIRLQRFPISYY